VTGPGPGPGETERGQLVLLAGVAAALALATLLAAYLQLGYAADVTATGVDDRPVRDGERVLERATGVVASDLRGTYSWAERDALVADLRAGLDRHRRSLESARADEGVAYRATYNATAAADWADEHCPGGRGRAFGPCVADRGVALQRRSGQPTVLAVAFDLNVTTAEGHTRLTLVVEPAG